MWELQIRYTESSWASSNINKNQWIMKRKTCMKKGRGFPENETFLMNKAIKKICIIISFHHASPLSNKNIKSQNSRISWVSREPQESESNSLFYPVSPQNQILHVRSVFKFFYNSDKTQYQSPPIWVATFVIELCKVRSIPSCLRYLTRFSNAPDYNFRWITTLKKCN